MRRKNQWRYAIRTLSLKFWLRHCVYYTLVLYTKINTITSPKKSPETLVLQNQVHRGGIMSAWDRHDFSIFHYYARQHICYSAYMPRQFRPSVCLSVCPSVTRVYCIKTAERIIEILSLSDRPIILVFGHQGSLCKSEGVTPNGGAKYKGVAIFDQYAAISRKR